MFSRIHRELTASALKNNWAIGFSAGVAVFANIPEDIDEALKRADALMYRVKNNGKNNLVFENQD